MVRYGGEQSKIEIHETFPKQTHRNRTVIETANGAMTLSVPVTRKNGNHTATRDIAVSYAERWNFVHWRAIESAYNASPYFLYYRDEVESLLMRRYNYLIDLNEATMRLMYEKMKCEYLLEWTEDFEKDIPPEEDYKDRYSYKKRDGLPYMEPYSQVFHGKEEFDGNVSFLDLLFNLGPESVDYLSKIRC